MILQSLLIAEPFPCFVSFHSLVFVVSDHRRVYMESLMAFRMALCPVIDVDSSPGETEIVILKWSRIG